MRAQERAVLGVNVTAAELRGLLEAARRGPFLFLRDGTGAQQVITLGGDRLVLGRASGSDLELSWDPRVSGVHAHLERRGPRWVVDDNGLSRNGTYVNGKRIRGQRTLADGDLIQMGDTLIGFRDPGPRVPAIDGDFQLGPTGVTTIPSPRNSDPVSVEASPPGRFASTWLRWETVLAVHCVAVSPPSRLRI